MRAGRPPAARFDSGSAPMSLTATKRQVVSATVSLRVPRGEAGNLESGVVDVLETVDTVESVALEHVASVRPTWTDIHVEADVGLELDSTVDVDDEEAVVATLEDGFGVESVEELAVVEVPDGRKARNA